MICPRVYRTPLLIVALVLPAITLCSRPFPDDPALTMTMLSILAVNNAGSTSASPKRIFVSQAQPGGSMGGITGADTLCNSDANRPDTTVSYQALLVDNVNRRACVNANCSPAAAGDGLNWVFAASTTYQRVESSVTTTLFTTGSNRIPTFPFQANGFSSNGGTEYWTGLDVDWSIAMAGPELDCADK